MDHDRQDGTLNFEFVEAWDRRLLKHYDYKTVRKITEGGQGVIFEIKSNIDGKTYIGKRLKFQIGSNLNESLVQSQAEREITLLKL